jgi:spectinomycin phosphotransferase
MLTRPDISDDSIIACLRDHFELRISQVTFLPLGADVNSAVFRVAADDGAAYFLKLRWGNFNEVAAAVAAFLHAQGIRRVMAPIATATHDLRVRAHGLDWILYPFFEGRNGFEAALSEAQWVALGASMRAVHTTMLPGELTQRVPHEDFSPRWRTVVRAFQAQVEQDSYVDPTAASFAALWTAKRDEIDRIVERAEQLAEVLQRRAAGLAVCHSDLHGGNVLVGADDALAIVDWDEPILAPKERDLMFIGGGVGGTWNDDQEAAWFYQGYGNTEIDPVALSYYRYERIVADFAAYGEQIFGMQGAVEDRQEGMQQVIAQFLPNNVIDISHRTYGRLS